MHIRYNTTTRRILYRSATPFTVATAAGEADGELTDEAADFEPLNQARLTADLSTLEIDPAAIPPPEPDYVGFIHWIPTAFSTAEILALNAAYVSFPWFCQYGNAEGMAYCITDALATARITSVQYTLFQQAVQTYHLPVVLP